MSVKLLLTAEDFLTMPEVPGKRFELVDGELVEMPGTGLLHNALLGHVFVLLRSYVRAHDLGMVGVDGLGIVLRRDPDIVRVPDVSFVARDRLPKGALSESFLPFAPDLAVEIVSPSDRAAEVHAKVREYLDAGSRVVWVMWSPTRSVSVHRAGLPTVELGPDDELDGGDVLPGFRVRVREILPPAGAPAA